MVDSNLEAIEEWATSLGLSPEAVSVLRQSAENNEQLRVGLLNTRQWNVEADAEADKVIQSLELIRDAYKMSAQESTTLLQKLHLSGDIIPKHIRESLHAYADNGGEMQLGSRTSALLQSNREALETARVARLTRNIKRDLLEISKKSENVQKEMEVLKRQELAGKIRLDQLRQEIKSKEQQVPAAALSTYESNLLQLSEHVKNLNIPANIMPEAIKEQIQEVQKVQRELAPLQKFVSQYQGLPPDVMLAKDVLAQEEKKLQELNHKIQSKLAEK